MSKKAPAATKKFNIKEAREIPQKSYAGASHIKKVQIFRFGKSGLFVQQNIC